MPQQIPAIGEDVTALMGSSDAAPEIGADVTYLMGGAEPETPEAAQEQPSFLSRLRRFLGDVGEDRIDEGAIRQAQEGMGGSPSGAALQGGLQGGANVLLPVALSKLAPIATQPVSRGAMRMAMGAQKAIRRKFPDVDLEAVALREGLTVSPGGVAKARGLGSAAREGISEAAQAADDAGVSPIQPREITVGLRRLYDRAGQARLPEQQRQIVEEANQIRKTFRGGVNVRDALAAKTERQGAGRAALPSAANPRAASWSSKIDAEISRGLGGAAKSRSPEVTSALQRSQEIMAVQRALEGATQTTPMLRTLLGASMGTGAGLATGNPLLGVATVGLNHILTSPRGLSLAAQAVDRYAEPAAREAARAALLALISDSTEAPASEQ